MNEEAFKKVQAAVEALVKPSVERTTPDKAQTALYDGRYAVFASLYPALKDSFALL